MNALTYTLPSLQIGYWFDTCGVYECTTTRTGHNYDLSAAFLAAIEDDIYMLPEKKSGISEKVRCLFGHNRNLNR